MKSELTITKGNQYNTDGYRLQDRLSALHAFGEIAARMDGSVGITWDGTFGPPANRGDRDAVERVIRQVITDGIARNIAIGVDAPAATPIREWRSYRGLTLTQEMDRKDSSF
jgi:hypothetical protein